MTGLMIRLCLFVSLALASPLRAQDSVVTLAGQALVSGSTNGYSTNALFSDPAAYDAWAPGWRARLAQEDDAPESRRTRMRSVNPAFIPRNHRIETAIRDAEVGRYDAFHELNNVLARPYEDQPQSARYTQPPAPHEEVLQTFCGT